MRDMPDDAMPRLWAAFCYFADNNDIGTHFEDWDFFWQTFKAGAVAEMEASNG